MYWDRFDICEAWYLFASQWHGGQSSKLYKVFGRLHRIGFAPSPILSAKSLSENGRAILASLIRRERAKLARRAAAVPCY